MRKLPEDLLRLSLLRWAYGIAEIASHFQTVELTFYNLQIKRTTNTLRKIIQTIY